MFVSDRARVCECVYSGTIPPFDWLILYSGSCKSACTAHYCTLEMSQSFSKYEHDRPAQTFYSSMDVLSNHRNLLLQYSKNLGIRTGRKPSIILHKLYTMSPHCMRNNIKSGQNLQQLSNTERFIQRMLGFPLTLQFGPSQLRTRTRILGVNFLKSI